MRGERDPKYKQPDVDSDSSANVYNVKSYLSDVDSDSSANVYNVKSYLKPSRL